MLCDLIFRQMQFRVKAKLHTKQIKWFISFAVVSKYFIYSIMKFLFLIIIIRNSYCDDEFYNITIHYRQQTLLIPSIFGVMIQILMKYDERCGWWNVSHLWQICFFKPIFPSVYKCLNTLVSRTINITILSSFILTLIFCGI